MLKLIFFIFLTSLYFSNIQSQKVKRMKIHVNGIINYKNHALKLIVQFQIHLNIPKQK